MLYFHMSENCDNIVSLNKTLYHICRKNHHNKCQTYTAYDVNYIPRGVVPLCKAQQHGRLCVKAFSLTRFTVSPLHSQAQPKGSRVLQKL